MTDATETKYPKRASEEGQPPRLALSAAAERALLEAGQRRNSGLQATNRPREINGPKGHEPVRYGDWDVKGRANDF